MYRYDEFDEARVRERVEQFRDQVARRLRGELSEEEFRPLRLMNGLYLQLHAYMLRVAIPYGTLSSKQLRKLAHIARKYDRGYGHWTTRQNIQFNWPKLEETPDLLSELADVEMHAIQTSGNCIRNVTSDPYAGVAPDEIEDPRVTGEIIRQWSTFHPEHSFLPRKFKIAVIASETDRAAMRFHDIGVGVSQNDAGEWGYLVVAGGGMGRTPKIGPVIKPWLPKPELLRYLEAIMRVYNRHGRRDNKYKARIKILVADLGADAFAAKVEDEWERLKQGELFALPDAEVERIRAYFAPPNYDSVDEDAPAIDIKLHSDREFRAWYEQNVKPHKQPGYVAVDISAKPIGGIPGDMSAEQMEAVADLAEAYSHDELRVHHTQNLVLPYVKKSVLYTVYRALHAADLATANVDLLSDAIACPGLDYCTLANARSIPIAQEISERFADIDRQRNVGPLAIKISGCINACGHHHAGHIGILGIDKRGEEFYQLTLGGSPGEDAAIGKIVGPAVPGALVTDAVETLIETYLGLRNEGETFLEAVRRVGTAPFKEALYDEDSKPRSVA
ncbi:MAG: nitrite/sulfite reductase [Myxococcota bacterium]